MNKIIAYCGLVCSECPAFIATQAGDREALDKIVEQWRTEYNAPNITLEGVMCDGCLDGGRKCGHCFECEVRACGIEKGVANCALCLDYACAKLEAFFKMVPQARTTLDALRP
ncbi:MAG: hypothetical protein A2Y69_02485 [Candidatus Aminicenantes bacterium RBG_13_59_9]|nr:MAG: hypothetical protein A2Y69_02485 [Candidatus Aminicenantes bacterium RBG_13_59_9]